MIRTYARLAAVVLLAAAVAGLVVLGWSVGEVFYHLGLGLLFGYAGFWQRDTTAVRLMVGAPYRRRKTATTMNRAGGEGCAEPLPYTT